MINSSIDFVNDVFEHHRYVKVRFDKKRRVPRDVLADSPEDAGVGGLSGGGAKELSAAEPEGGNAVVLVPADVGEEVESDAGPGAGAGGGRRRRVGGREGRAVDGVGEGVVEEVDGA